MNQRVLPKPVPWAVRRLASMAFTPFFWPPADAVLSRRHGLPEFVAERELDAREAGLFLQLALRARELVLAGIHQALRKIPVVVRAQHEEVDAAAGLAADPPRVIR